MSAPIKNPAHFSPQRLRESEMQARSSAASSPVAANLAQAVLAGADQSPRVLAPDTPCSRRHSIVPATPRALPGPLMIPETPKDEMPTTPLEQPRSRFRVGILTYIYPQEIHAMFAALIETSPNIPAEEKLVQLRKYFGNLEQAANSEGQRAEASPPRLKISEMIDLSLTRSVECQVESILTLIDSAYPSIKHIDLSGIGLQKIPYALSLFREVTHLDLSHNRLETVTDRAAGDLYPFHDTVTHLNLAYNSITGLDAKWENKLPAMRNLKHLDLGNNKIAKVIQFKDQENGDPGAPQLESLYLNRNAIFMDAPYAGAEKSLIDYYVFDIWMRQCPKLKHIGVSISATTTMSKLIEDKFPSFGITQIGTSEEQDFILLSKLEDVPVRKKSKLKQSSKPNAHSDKHRMSYASRSPGGWHKAQRAHGPMNKKYQVKPLPKKALDYVQAEMDRVREAHLEKMGLGHPIQAAPAPVLPNAEPQPLGGQLLPMNPPE